MGKHLRGPILTFKILSWFDHTRIIYEIGNHVIGSTSSDCFLSGQARFRALLTTQDIRTESL